MECTTRRSLALALLLLLAALQAASSQAASPAAEQPAGSPAEAGGPAAVPLPPAPPPAPEGTWQALLANLGIPLEPEALGALESAFAPAAEQAAALQTGSTDTTDGWSFEELQPGGAALGPAAGPAAEAAGPAAEAAGGRQWSFVELPVEQQPAAAAPAEAAAALPPQYALFLPSGAGPAAEEVFLGPKPRAAPLPLLAPAPGAEAAPQYAAAVAAPPLPQQWRCWVQAATDFSGGDLLPAGNSSCCSSSADCCRTCWETPGCGAWCARGGEAQGARPGPNPQMMSFLPPPLAGVQP